MFQTYDDYAEWGEKVYEASGGTVTLFPGSQDVSNMMMQQQRNINNVDADGNVNVTGKVQKVFETVKKLMTATPADSWALILPSGPMLLQMVPLSSSRGHPGA